MPLTKLQEKESLDILNSSVDFEDQEKAEINDFYVKYYATIAFRYSDIDLLEKESIKLYRLINLINGIIEKQKNSNIKSQVNNSAKKTVKNHYIRGDIIQYQMYGKIYKSEILSINKSTVTVASPVDSKVKQRYIRYENIITANQVDKDAFQYTNTQLENFMTVKYHYKDDIHYGIISSISASNEKSFICYDFYLLKAIRVNFIDVIERYTRKTVEVVEGDKVFCLIENKIQFCIVVKLAVYCWSKNPKIIAQNKDSIMVHQCISKHSCSCVRINKNAVLWVIK